MSILDILPGWGKAQKKPIIVDFREPIHTTELITTLEGELRAHQGEHYVIVGVEGELYPIDIEIFKKTYDVVVPLQPLGETQA